MYRTVYCGRFPHHGRPKIFQYNDSALQPACYFALSGRDSSPGNAAALQGGWVCVCVCVCKVFA